MEAYQAILSLTVSLSLLKFMSIGSVMVSNYLILCHPLLFLPSMFPSTRVFSSELALSIRCPAYSVSASATVLSMNTQGWFPLELTSAFSLKSKGISRMFSSTTIWKHQSFGVQPSVWSTSHICTWLLGNPQIDYMDFCWLSDLSAF